LSIPITLITGFLGAGKSTLINRVISENPGIRFGLIINEFGDVKLESQIIESSGDQVTELSNGCMCCVVRGDLIKTVEGLLKKSPDIGHIILEASGLSDPVPIANTFLNDEMGGRVHFDSVVCVVDPINFISSLADYPVAEAQILYSDFILVSKVDVVSPTQVNNARNLILSRRHDARILEIGGGFPLNLVFDTSRVDHSKLAGLEIEEHHHHEHEDDQDDEGDGHKTGIVAGVDGKQRYHHVHETVDTLFYKTLKPLDLERFGAVMHKLPREVVRAKGFLDFADPETRGKKFVLQMVGGRPVLAAKAWETGEVRQSAMVFIGKGFDKEKLLASMRACELEPVLPGRAPARR
jgi:G3E family GTPase